MFHASRRCHSTVSQDSAGPEFIGLLQNCNIPATFRRYRSASDPSNREGLSGRPWGAPGCPFYFGELLLATGRGHSLRQAYPSTASENEFNSAGSRILP